MLRAYRRRGPRTPAFSALRPYPALDQLRWGYGFLTVYEYAPFGHDDEGVFRIFRRSVPDQKLAIEFDPATDVGEVSAPSAKGLPRREVMDIRHPAELKAVGEVLGRRYSTRIEKFLVKK